jgi:intergrase/recombinase
MKALSALAKFLGIHEDFQRLVKSYGLKWSVNNDDVILARLSRNSSTDDLIAWVKTVKREIPILAVFMDFITATGLRFDEAINSYSMIAQNTSGYYNQEQQSLEHFRFRQVFIRRTKKCFCSFVPKELIEKIKSPLTHDMIKKRLQRRGLRSRFGEIRELYATCSTKHLRQPEIDFVQGRMSATVFARNYFNPILISDLKNRAITNANELLESVQCAKSV